MQPGAVGFGGVRNLLERVEGARVHLAGLRAHDRRRGVALECVRECRGIHSALLVRGNRLGCSESEQA